MRTDGWLDLCPQLADSPTACRSEDFNFQRQILLWGRGRSGNTRDLQEEPNHYNSNLIHHTQPQAHTLAQLWLSARASWVWPSVLGAVCGHSRSLTSPWPLFRLWQGSLLIVREHFIVTESSPHICQSTSQNKILHRIPHPAVESLCSLAWVLRLHSVTM